MQRRQFMLSAAAGGLLLPTGLVLADDIKRKVRPPPTGGGTPPASPKARVIVVGGGMAGATVAKYLRLWGDAVDVTLIERHAGGKGGGGTHLTERGQQVLRNFSLIQAEHARFIARLDALCEISGIGLVTFDIEDPAAPQFRVVVRPRQHQPDLFYTNRYLALIERELFS
jgi:molybdate transport repressor ModE-like protein